MTAFQALRANLQRPALRGLGWDEMRICYDVFKNRFAFLRFGGLSFDSSTKEYEVFRRF
jgi:hypothetical protein